MVRPDHQYGCSVAGVHGADLQFTSDSSFAIGTTLGINVGTVKSRIARARENLRTLLAEACPEFAPGAAPGEWFLPSRATYGRPHHRLISPPLSDAPLQPD